MKHQNAPVKSSPLWKKPDKFRFGDKVRYIGNAAMRVSNKQGVVIEHNNIACPMSRVLFTDGTTGYIADNELEAVREFENA